MRSYEILIGDEIKGLPKDAAESLIEITVLQDISAPSMFAIRLTNWDKSKGEVTWSDREQFEPGTKVTIKLPGKNRLVSVMEGEITGLEPEFHSTRPMIVTVRGYDHRHRLMRGTKTRAFPQKKDSDIARQVASAVSDDTKVRLDCVMQHNQTDLEFLQARASRLGFEVVVADETLKFREHREQGKSSVMTLSRTGNLEEFYPRLSTIGLAGEVIVRGWSARDKMVVTGKAKADNLKKMGSNIGLEAFEGAQAVIVDQPVQSEEEAFLIALGRLREMALTYITGEGVAIGCADLKAGTVVRIDGYGKRFDGHYYLTSVRHTYSSSGYRTAFAVQRNAS